MADLWICEGANECPKRNRRKDITHCEPHPRKAGCDKMCDNMGCKCIPYQPKESGLWTCDHIETCKNLECWAKRGEGRHQFDLGLLQDGFECEFHNTGSSNHSDPNIPLVKAIPYQPKEEKMKEYETTDKPITRFAIIMNAPKDCDDATKILEEFDACFGSRYSLNETILYTDRLKHFLADHPQALEWALKEGYVREKEPEVFYSRGDRFNYRGDELVLAMVGDGRVGLIHLEGPHNGLVKSEAKRVEDTTKITRIEFLNIAGLHAEEIIKIEPKPTKEELPF